MIDTAVKENKIRYIRDKNIDLLAGHNAYLSQVNNNIKYKKDIVNSQIKSTQNRGTFRPDTGNIYQQGRIQNGFYDAELNVIVLGRNFNTTTLPHEMSHFWLNTYFKLFKQAQRGEIQVSEQWLTEVKTLFNMLGINKNQENLTRVQQERWAALNEGVITGYAGIPSDCALPITEYLNWIPEKYKSILQIGYLDENGNIQRHRCFNYC